MARDAEGMAHTRSFRGPMSDPRDGRLLRQIRRAFVGATGDVTTAWLLSYCYSDAHQRRQIKSWRRRNVIKTARRVAIPIRRRAGKGAGSGRPFVWEPIQELIEERSRVGRWRRRQARKVTGY